MANELTAARDGLKTLLENISGLRVYGHEPEAVHELPAALLRIGSRGTQITVGGSSFVGAITVTLLLSSADHAQSQDDLTKYMDPLGAKSIEAQLDSDPTWGGSVDDGRLATIGGFRVVEIAGGRYSAADFECKFVKQAAS